MYQDPDHRHQVRIKSPVLDDNTSLIHWHACMHVAFWPVEGPVEARQTDKALERYRWASDNTYSVPKPKLKLFPGFAVKSSRNVTQ